MREGVCLVGLLASAEEVETKLRSIATSGNTNRYDGADALFCKKWIDSFQEKRFHARDGFRDPGLHPHLATKVELLPANVISSGETDCSTGNAEVQL